MRVVGRVQGVYFRASTQIEANKLGITGWVKNTSDGDVYIEAEGSEESLEQFMTWLHKGPKFAAVRQVIVESVENVEVGESPQAFDIL